MKRCSIQIIDEDETKGGFAKRRWIALAKDIDYEHNMYNNVNEYHPKECVCHTKLDKGFFWRLLKGRTIAKIAPWDIIRNPTMEELIEISEAAKINGLKINLKTGEYIGKF